MFVKIVRGGHESLYPVEAGPLDYGTRYLYDDPITDQTWLEELRAKTGYDYCYFLVAGEVAQPAGYREFMDPENHPDDHGKPWWMVRWIAYDGGPRGEGYENTRCLIVTFGDVFIVGDNGKTIDRVRA